MNSIISKDSVVHFKDRGYSELKTILDGNNFSKIIIIVDSNTHENCLSLFFDSAEISNDNVEIIEIMAGEEHKSIDTCTQVWSALSEIEADRKSLIINLGGGVVTDLGGFIACTFKRGIGYINVPTSLLAMVDASVGGKTGVDLGGLKNQIGVISNGEMVLIDTKFLKTLPQNQMKSGLAEMLKHGLIADEEYWKKLINLTDLTIEDLDQLIYDSVVIKNEFVSQDPRENGVRKALNFGHTLGHAIESYHLENSNRKDLLHGEAIAIGMILECFLSYKLHGFSFDKLENIKSEIKRIYPSVSFQREDLQIIIDLLKHDKKNSHGQVKFTLLKDIGQPLFDCIVKEKLIFESFDYYQN